MKWNINVEGLIAQIIPLITGAAGGNIGGALFKNLSLGTLGNSLAGIVGGGIGGNLLMSLLGSGASSGLIGQVAGGTVGGTVLMAIIGLIKRIFAR